MTAFMVGWTSPTPQNELMIPEGAHYAVMVDAGVLSVSEVGVFVDHLGVLCLYRDSLIVRLMPGDTALTPQRYPFPVSNHAICCFDDGSVM